MLQAHILHLHGDEGAIFNGLVEGPAGVVGVDVNLDNLVVVHQYQAVANGGQEVPQLLRVVLVLPGDDELGAVGEGDILGVEVGEIRLLLHLVLAAALGHHHILTPQGAEHGLQSEHPALAAGIHHPGLLQHRVLVDGVGQGDPGLFQGGLLDKFDEIVLPGGLGGLGSRQPGHGEDGALGGLHHRLVGGIHTVLQSGGPEHAVGGVAALQGLGNSPEQQGKNHAGVASCPPQHGGGGNLGGGVQLRVLGLAQVGGGGVDGHGHIGAGVAVGNREHIQLVQRLLVNLNGCGSADNHPAKLGAVNGLPQFLFSSVLSQSSWNR